jgi:hypothetical protein
MCWICFAVFVVCICLMIIGSIIQGRREQNPRLEDLQDPQIPILPIDSMDVLGRYVSVYNSRNPEEICAICCETLATYEEVVQLPSCQHVFHYICLREWLAIEDVCPLCKRPTNLV